ncbi:MAG: 1-acyl-sn-glycerol-3-phosphate acyltransferase [Bifidobacteriaceae bacterium]|nr:1-acyl-sn-glycerol-3-phosphate acyltransferase [Bifidobacteriaceae bacterium]
MWLATRVDGCQHIPRRGPAIVAANHSGLLDGPIIMGAAGRGVHFLIKEALSKGPLGLALRAAGQIPVWRGLGKRALEVGLEVLKDDRVVGIFPEGTRGQGRASSIHAGVGWLAVKSGAPVIPANNPAGIDPVKPAQPLKVLLNTACVGAPVIPANKPGGMDPVKPVQPSKVPANIPNAGAPVIPANNPAGMALVKPVQ